MRLTPVPLLARLRALYDQPRDVGRFRAYLAELTGGGDDMALPISGFNPMGREHVAEALDHLLAAEAEDAMAEACVEAERRLADLPIEFRVALVPADDIGGMWTERQDVTLRERLDPTAHVKRGWCAVTTWTSERPDRASVRRETLAAVYRSAHVALLGRPVTLGDLLRQEGRATRFAGIRPTLPPVDVDAARDALEPLRGARDYPTIFAAYAGDEAAAMYGYAPLGLAPGAALAVALDDALGDSDPPKAALARAGRE